MKRRQPYLYIPTLQENVDFLTQKLVICDTFEVILWFHPLQYTICDVYYNTYYIKMGI
jgi:hypothetical protein